MGNETAGDNPSHDNVPSIIPPWWPPWPSFQIECALKRVGFVVVLDKIWHGRHPCQSPASSTGWVSRHQGKHSLRTVPQILCDNSRCKAIACTKYRRLAHGSSGYCLISCQALRSQRYFWMRADRVSSINVGVIEGDEDSPGTPTSDEAILKREGTFIAHQI